MNINLLLAPPRSRVETLIYPAFRNRDWTVTAALFHVQNTEPRFQADELKGFIWRAWRSLWDILLTRSHDYKMNSTEAGLFVFFRGEMERRDPAYLVICERVAERYWSGERA